LLGCLRVWGCTVGSRELISPGHLGDHILNLSSISSFSWLMLSSCIELMSR